MIHLKVYSDIDKTNQWFLDLYETEPIKLNLSIEDITDAEARSVFSRTFRVPATTHNNRFFKNAFLIDGIDYDVTIKKPAEILVDGAEFRQGHIRLQKIFVNGDTDKIDYEIVFFGETRDFASSIGDAGICELSIPSLTHVLNRDNVVASWDAYPEGATETDGLVNGDVIYPLIDHGLEYPTSNANPRIGLGFSHTFENNGLPVNRMKPMIRAKALWDAIFEKAGYTYTSNFINPTSPNEFTQLYVSAFGNEASPYFDTAQSSLNNASARAADQFDADREFYCPIEISDVGGNYNPGTDSTGSTYTAPLSGTYRIKGTCYYEGQGSYTGGPPYTGIDGRLEIYVNGSSVAVGSYGNNSTLTVDATISLVANDEVQIVNTPGNGPFERGVVRDATFEVLESPGNVNPVANMDCEYKQIDFIKDILTTFRMVMAPDAQNPKNFIVEPWTDYIASGDLHDWSDKLVKDKDTVIEPLFFTQSDTIEFDHEKDGDWLNVLHEDQYNRIFGYLEFDSGNELLTNQRAIKTGWSPTPLTQIDATSGSTNDEWILPQLHTHEPTDTEVLNEPLRPNTRFLFYNGLIDITNNNNWRLVDNTNLMEYPMVSYSSVWPLHTNGTILNWNTDIGYWGTVTGYPTQGGATIYDKYWSGYINSLYNKNARKITAYFILNNVDLQTFSFDDVIFVNGTYYRPEKIIDAQIGERTAVKCELIKLLDYQPDYAIFGCTNPTATNYDPMANVDDGSCILPIYGCTDPTADNYNPNANTDDGSCNYAPPTIEGCTDGEASNYNPAANSDDGSCIYPVYGCTDAAANNYNPLATVDDGTCDYTPGPVLGCTNDDAVNYNPLATQDDGTCYFLPIEIFAAPAWVLQPSCFGEQGVFDVSFTGGDPPYTMEVFGNGQSLGLYTGVPSETAVQVFGFAGGTLQFNVTDELTPNPNSVVHIATLDSGRQAIVPNITTTTSTATINASGGSGGLQLVAWNGVDVVPAENLPAQRSGLLPGTSYSYRIQDSSGCFIDGTAITLAKQCTQLGGETLVYDPGSNIIKLVFQGSSGAPFASKIVNFFNGNNGATENVSYSFQKPFMDINFTAATGSPTYTYNVAGSNISWFYDGVEVVVQMTNIGPGIPGGTYLYDPNVFTYCKY